MVQSLAMPAPRNWIMKILIAPTAWKGILSARQVAASIDEALRELSPNVQTIVCPIADGGNDTLNCLVDSTKGFYYKSRVIGPFYDRTVEAKWGVLGNVETAVIETAQAAGIHLLKKEEYNPLIATSYGVGELIKHALNRNCRKILVCMGGTASIDGGLGCLQALGVVYEKKKFDLLTLDMRFQETEVEILCDVMTPLCGPMGAVAIFGPQKGANRENMAQLQKNIDEMAKAMEEVNGKVKYLPGGGAAGGLAAGLHAILKAPLVPGFEKVFAILKMEEKLKECDLVITGEGKLDAQTLLGKAVYGMAKEANKLHKPIYAFNSLVEGSDELKMKLCLDEAYGCLEPGKQSRAEYYLKKKIKDVFQKMV